MIELNKEDFYKVKHLLDRPLVNHEVHAVVEGYNPGYIFTSQDYKTALVWSLGIEGFYLVGDEDNKEFNQTLDTFFSQTIERRARALGLTYVELSVTSKAWEEIVYDLFPSRTIAESKQLVYSQSKTQTRHDLVSLPDGYVLKKVTKDLLDGPGDHSFVTDNILTWWQDLSNFFKHGFGYAVYYKNRAVCSCVASFRSHKAIENHIETEEDHRKKGLARQAIRAFANEAKTKRLDLYWDCMSTNEGSRSLAVGGGYELSFDYKLFEFNF